MYTYLAKSQLNATSHVTVIAYDSMSHWAPGYLFQYLQIVRIAIAY